jgi:hypothetical protein
MNKNDVISFLERERDELLEKVRSIEMTILTMKQSLSIAVTTHPNEDHVEGVTKSNSNQNNYQGKYKNYASLNIREKAIAILKAEGRFLHMRQIVEIAQSLEPLQTKR